MSNVVIKYQDIAIDAKKNFDPSVSEQEYISDIFLLKEDDVEYNDFSNPCEFYSFFLDGEENIIPEDFEKYNYGLWSKQISNEEGLFDNPIYLTFQSDVFFTSIGISLTFDNSKNIFSNFLNIKWYRGEELLSDIDFRPNDSEYFCYNKVDFYNKIVITFYGVCLPYNRLKLKGIEFGLKTKFDGFELLSTKMIQEINPVSTEIAINTCDFVLSSKKDIEYSFQVKQPLSIFFDDELKATTFITSAKRKSRTIWAIQSEDYIGLLETIPFYGGIYKNKNAVELLEEIFQIAKVPFSIDKGFENDVVNGYIPYSTCREALMQVAFSIQAVVDTSNSDLIKVYALKEEITQNIPLSRIMRGQNFEEGTRVTAVELYSHSYSLTSEILKVYDANESGVGEHIFVKFTEPLYDVSITEGEIISSGSNYAIINANSNGCVLEGKKYKHNTSIKSIKNPLVLSSDVENIVAIQNATLVSKENIDKILEKCYNYFVNVDRINLKIIDGKHMGNDGAIVYEKKTNVGDLVGIETDYLGTKIGRIIKQNFGLNSGVLVKESVVK